MSLGLTVPLVGEVRGYSRRELNEFLESKRIKREPVRMRLNGVAEASCSPPNMAAFLNLRDALRDNPDFGQASEQLDKIETRLHKRHACGFPLPADLRQTKDRCLSVSWGDPNDLGSRVAILASPERVVTLIGGPAGLPQAGVGNDLLDALAFRVKFLKAGP